MDAALTRPQIELRAGTGADIVQVHRSEEEQMTIAAGLATPVIVRGSRTPAVGSAVGVALMLGFLLLAGTPWGSGLKPLSVLGVGFFGALEILCLIVIVAPDRLEISPSGVLVRHLWLVRRFGWDQLSNFRLVGGASPYGSDRIIASVQDGARQSRLSPRLMASEWELPTAHIFSLLEEGRAQWGRSPAVVADKESRPSAPLVLGDRVGRRRYWTVIAVTLACVAALSVLPVIGGLEGGLAAVLLTLSRGRLHDIGLSGWWSLGALPAAVVLSLTRDNLPYLQHSLLNELSPAAAALLCGLALALGLLVWLGIEPGDPSDNGYGLTPARRPRLIL